jgi:hypothetical protein
VASALSVEPAGPYVPATHGVPLHAFALGRLLCVPGTQGTQAFTPVYMPASHVERHGVLSLLEEYSPKVHGEHAESEDSDPAA